MLDGSQVQLRRIQGIFFCVIAETVQVQYHPQVRSLAETHYRFYGIKGFDVADGAEKAGKPF
jgi:hypothetical protein